MKKIATYFLIVTLVISCSSSHHIEKRRYRKGFFVQWNNKVKETPQSETKPFKNNKESIENNQQDGVLYAETPGYSAFSTKEKKVEIDNKKETKSAYKNAISVSKNSQRINKDLVELTKRKTTSNSIVKQLYDNWLYVFAAIITALTSWLFVFKREKSKNISKWASRNPKKAIWTIVSVKIALAFGALHFGSWLFGEGVNFSTTTLTTFFSLFLVSGALYPHKRKRKGLFKQGYVRQKLHDISIVSLGAMMIMSLGNLSSQDASFSPPLNTFITNTSSYDNASEDGSIGDDKESDESDDKIVLKILLSILAMLVFVSLLYLVAILTCVFACNGQEALAIGVLVFGLTGIIMLLVMVFKAIWSASSTKKKGLNPDL